MLQTQPADLCEQHTAKVREQARKWLKSSMSLKNRTRWRRLCSQALAETDPQKLAVLLTKIDDILCQTIDGLEVMRKDVEQMLRRREQFLSRIRLVKRIEAPCFHEVGFYSDDRQFLEHVTQFVGAALKDGDAAILVTTESHRDSLLARLQAFGVNIGVAIEEGRYVVFDVGDALATFMRDGMPDPVRFMKTFDQLILTATKATKAKHPRVAIFGEGVHLLCAQGNAEAAIQVEKLANQLIKAYDVDILCGYFPLRIASGLDDDIFQRISEEHSALHSF
jgi:hypothetical protein